MRLHHISRLTKRLPESRRFYCEVLGFREIPRPNFSFGGAWLFNGELQIHLIENMAISDPAVGIDTRENHIAFEVADVEDFERRLVAWGVPFRVNIQATTNVKQLFFRDPDGHHIEIGTYGPTRTEGPL